MSRNHTAHISNRLLIILRVVWIMVSLTAIGLTIIGIVTLNRAFNLPCERQDTGEYCQLQAEALQSLGISPVFYGNWLTIGVIIEVFPFFIAGGLIFWRRSHTWVGLLFSSSIMLASISTIDPNLYTWTEFAYPDTSGIIHILSFLGNILIMTWFFFPDEKLTHRWLQWFIGFWIIRDLGIWFFQDTFLDMSTLSLWVHMGIQYTFAALLTWVFIDRYRHADMIQRQQIKWVVMGTITFIVLYFIQELSFEYFRQQANIRGMIIGNFTITSVYYLSSGFVASSIVIAIFRYRLFDIDIIIRRTLQYGAITGILALIYFSGVVLTQSVFRNVARDFNSPLATVITTLTIAALFNPLRRRVQDFIDRRFYRQKYNAEQVIAQFNATVRDEVDIDHLTTTLIHVIQTTMQPESLSIWIKDQHKPNARQEIKR